MVKAKRRKLLAPNFGTTRKFTSGMGFSNDKKEEFAAYWLRLRSPHVFAEDYPVLSREQGIQHLLVKSSLVVITRVEVRASKLLVLTFIERSGLVISLVEGYKKLGKLRKVGKLEKIGAKINKYYTFELKKAKGDANKFIDTLQELPGAQLPL